MCTGVDHIGSIYPVQIIHKLAAELSVYLGRLNRQLLMTSTFTIAPRETDPTPVMTRSSETSRVEPTSAMVTRSRAREGRGISVIPETEFRLETE